MEKFHPAVQRWFRATFAEPTEAQRKGWPPLLDRRSMLLLAPTGSGKTLAAFLAAIDRLIFGPEPLKKERCRVLYVSPLKALAVDVEKNLRVPIAGITAEAAAQGEPHRELSIAVRSGDTPASERAKMSRTPPDIFITTPESLYLLLTSAASEALESVETVIVDEIHSMVASKRGAHLFLSLERLEAMRRAAGRLPLQRIGLSATQRPLEEIARLLGGGEPSRAEGGVWRPRVVDVVDAGRKKPFAIRVEVPVEDMARLKTEVKGAGGDPGGSIWPSVHPRLVELIKAHRSTIIFTNARRLAERLSAALNEVAKEEIALAHHGSLSREKRQEVEERLKKGKLAAIVATSSLELGIDMGAVDLVIQIEAPPSVAAGMQRIGRAGHTVGAVSQGIIFPKFRGDLLACAAAVERMQEGSVEETFYPRNPLDVLAQQIVATASMAPIAADDLYVLVRRAAPFAQLARSAFDGVLDMLSGLYPSDEFAELRPRITWDRLRGMIVGREGARKTAVVNAGTIPDRGLYGVFLAGGDEKKSRRVGELDEEMVFESRIGDVFLLGASSWRIVDITHDRVIVVPAPGEAGRMPFWHGDRPGRPLELGRAIGALTRKLAGESAESAIERLTTRHALDVGAAKNLIRYLEEQQQAIGEVPTDETLVLERSIDESGGHRVCLLSPFGARVHAPWAAVVRARILEESGIEADTIWSDDGIVFTLPESEDPPDADLFFPAAGEVEDVLIRSLGDTSLFAAHFRECAARALLLPRRHPGRRSPLWVQRKRSQDLLAVASRYGSFPMLLETYRECLRDVFDLPGLMEILDAIAAKRVRVAVKDSRPPSPFAASLMFSYVANFIYEGDAPLAERRAQALTVDRAQLAALIGAPELRDLLDAQSIDALSRVASRLDGRTSVRHADAVHDLLLLLGDLAEDEILARGAPPDRIAEWLTELERSGRALRVRIAGETRYIAAEDAGRYRDALSVEIPPEVPDAFLNASADAFADLVSRWARTHGPFSAGDVARRFGVSPDAIEDVLRRLADRGRVVEGKFRGEAEEWCDAELLRSIKRRSLAKLRRQIEPVEPEVYARFLLDHHGIERPRAGLEGLLQAIEKLQGAAMPASAWERDVLAARVKDYRASDLDALSTAGEIVWRGIEPLGTEDGRVAIYLADHLPLLAPKAAPPSAAEPETRIRELLRSRGALFFADIALLAGGFPQDVFRGLWNLVWAGEVTNDTLAPLRSLGRGKRDRARQRLAYAGRSFRTRRAGPPGSEGRWSLLPAIEGAASDTARLMSLANTLLDRYGVLVREAVQAENVAGGFSALYPVLKAMEDAGKIRRGYFVAGLGATQFARKGADDRLRAIRDRADPKRTVVLAATDPANPYGGLFQWPDHSEGGRPQRAAGAHVILHDGQLIAWAGRTERNLLTFLPSTEPRRTEAARAIADALNSLVREGRRRAVLIDRVDGVEPRATELGRHLVEAGFIERSRGYLRRGPVV